MGTEGKKVRSKNFFKKLHTGILITLQTRLRMNVFNFPINTWFEKFQSQPAAITLRLSVPQVNPKERVEVRGNM